MSWNEPGGGKGPRDPWGGKDQGPPDLDEALRDDLDDLADAAGHVVHRELDRVLPHLLQEVEVLGLRRRDLQVGVDRLRELAPLLELWYPKWLLFP